MKVKRTDGTEVDVRHYYFGRALWAQHHGIATAGVAKDVDGPGTCRLAFAFCSPLDPFRRRTEKPLVRAKRDKSGKIVQHPDMTLTPITETIRRLGGVDIVHARLGIVPLEGVDENYIKIEYPLTIDDKALVQLVIVHFNQGAYPGIPQLWQQRTLCLGKRRLLARYGAWTREELEAARDIVRPEQVQGGFIPKTEYKVEFK